MKEEWDPRTAVVLWSPHVVHPVSSLSGYEKADLRKATRFEVLAPHEPFEPGFCVSEPILSLSYTSNGMPFRRTY